MNLTKKRKITAIVTVSVMLVAIVATACILYAPGTYKGNDVTTKNTGLAYGMNEVAYNNKNAAMVYANFNSGGDAGDAKILFPTVIYLDKSESLTDAGYYVAYNVWSSPGNGSNASTVMFDTNFGYFAPSVRDRDENKQYTVMHNTFDNYYFSESIETKDKDNNQVGKIRGGGSGTEVWKNSNSGVDIEGKGPNIVLKNVLQGELKDSVKNSVKVEYSDGSYKGSSYDATFTRPTNSPIGYLRWYGYVFLSGEDWRDIDDTIKYGFVPTSNTPNGNYFYLNGDNLMGNIGIKDFTKTTYEDDIQIKIHIYDKSALNTAINYFEENVLTDGNKTALNRISGSDGLYEAAKAYFDEAKAALTTREVTQETIDDYTNGLYNYTFEIPTFTSRSNSKSYDGEALNISDVWTRFDSTYFNLKVNDSTSDTEIKNANGNQSKVYNISVSPKTQVGALKLQWADENNRTGYKSIGTYTIRPATFQVSGPQDMSRSFKNSNYDVSLTMASNTGVTYPGFVDGDGNNTKQIFLVIDEEDKETADIDWSNAQSTVPIKDVGTYTVYYKVTAPNHYDYASSFAVEITKANIELMVTEYYRTYGDKVLDSDEIIEKMLKNTGDILDAQDWETKKAYIKEICDFQVNITSTTPGTDYANVGTYHITYTRKNTALSDSVNQVTFYSQSNRNAYQVVPRNVTVEWTQQSDMYYDGKGNKRPSAKIIGDNFADGTSTSLSDVEIAGPGQDFEGYSVPLDHGEAIYAGKYTAFVECLNPNYDVDPATDTCTFEILRRPITVVLKQRSRTYAGSTYKDAKTATLAWQYYINTLFPANTNQTIYEASIDTTLVKDGRGAILGGVANAPNVFEINLAQINDDIYTSTTESERYFKVGTYDLTLNLIDKNYVLTEQSKGASFIINPAMIDLDLQRVASKTYNGNDQNITITNNNTVITLQGFEATHRSGVTIEYKDGANGTYSSKPLTMKNVGTKEIYYKVSAPNHKTSEGHFTAEITPVHIVIDVAKTATAMYGDEAPTSEQLVKDLGIELIWDNKNEEIEDISSRLLFEISDMTDRRAKVGRYDLTHKLINDELEQNYDIEYTKDQNGNEVRLDVYIIKPREIYVEWKQSGPNWADNGMEYFYDGDVPEIKPIAPYTFNGEENVISPDKISLTEPELDDDIVGEYTVSTSLDGNNNYVLHKSTATATFKIVPRVVEICVKNQTATYGSAKTIQFASVMLSDTDAHTKWAYPSGVADTAKFLSDDYSAFRLVSRANSAPEGQYMDVDKYSIRYEIVDEDVARNYDVRIVEEGDMQAIFEILPADIHFMGREFNIEFDNAKENNYVSIGDIRDRISTALGTKSGEFSVEMSDIFAQKNDDGSDNNVGINDPSVTWIKGGDTSHTTEIDRSQPANAKRYYVWVRITHKNYNDFEAKIEVNILSNWVSIVLGKKIEAQYGDDTFSSQELFEKADILEVYYKDSDGVSLEDKKAMLQGYVEGDHPKIQFYVGRGDAVHAMEKNEAFGEYSIYIKVLTENLEDGDFENFRFLDANHESGNDKITTNINNYKVGQRIIGINWGEMNETYGEHSDSSPSHTYELDNLREGDDDVYVTIMYQMKVGSGWVNMTSHAKNVGKYRAIVTGVSDTVNYKLPEQELIKEFEITPRPVKIIISDRPMDNSSLIYGSENMSRDGIDSYLNTQKDDFHRYEVAEEKGYYGILSTDSVNSIFRFKLESFNGLADNLQYLSAGTYNIIPYQKNADGKYISSVSANYAIEYDNPGKLTIEKYEFEKYTPQTINAVYIGKDFSVVYPLNYINWTGDGDELLKGKDTKEFVQYKLATDNGSKYSPDLKVKNAGTYTVKIKINEPNHEQLEFEFKLVVARAYVLINMTKTAEKDYGDTVNDLTNNGKDGTFSDWLIKHCNITIKAYNRKGGSLLDVAGLATDFQFKVIKKGQGNGEALSVGKNPVGTYRVYHENDTELSKNYIIDYYQDPSMPDSEEYKCNSDAYKINPKKVKVTWVTEGYIDNVENRFEYSNSAPTVYATCLLIGDTKATVIPTDFILRSGLSDKEKASAVNVGKYTAKIEYDSSDSEYEELGNYDFTNDTYDFEIVPKKVTVIIRNQTAVYGTNNSKVGVWASHTAYDLTDGIEFLEGQPIELYIKEAEANKGKTYYNVGTYSIVGKCTSGNYEVTFKGRDKDGNVREEGFADFVIKEADIKINEDDKEYSKTYDGKEFVVDVKDILEQNKKTTLAGDMKLSDATVTYRQNDGNYTSVKPVIEKTTTGLKVEYKINVANHNEYTGSMTVAVLPAEIYVNVDKGATTVYGESVLTSDQLFKYVKLDENKSSMTLDLKSILTLKVVTTSGATVSAKPNAGNYNISATLKPEYDGLYNVHLNGAGGAYSVTQKVLTVEWSYNGPFVYDGHSHSVTAKLVGAIAGDNVGFSESGYIDYEFVDAGDYVAKVSGLNNRNYKLAKEYTLEWKINPKSIEIVWTPGDFTYDGKNKTLKTPTIKDVSQLVEGDVVPTISVKYDNRVNAGTHTATATSSDDNYVISNNTFEFVIKPAVISITWSKDTLTYNGEEQGPTATVKAGQLVGNDKCKVIVSGAQKNAGENYKATATLDNTDYKIREEDASCTFAIAPKAITFEWVEDTKTLAYTGEQQTPKASAIGAIEGDEVEFDIAVEEGEGGINVGQYVAVVKGVLNTNYVIDEAKQSDMTTQYTIVKGVNEFYIDEPSKTVSELPWSGDDKPKAKWGEVVVKYYSDEACTQEVTDIRNAKEGKYWITLTVAGTENYDEISKTIEVVLEGDLNLTIVIVGAIISIVLLISAFAVVKSTDKKKKQKGDAK